MNNGVLWPVRYLFVVGTPGAGKSTVGRELEALLQASKFQVNRAGDYPYLQKLFHSDMKQERRDRFRADPEAEFEVLDPAIYDEALKLLWEDQLSQSEESQQRIVHIVEFSRPAYDTSFSYYPLKILMHGVVIHVAASIEICRVRNDRRREALANKQRDDQNRHTIFSEDPDLHYVPDAVMSKYYAKDANEDRKRLYLQRRALSFLPFRGYFQLDNSGDDREAFIERVRAVAAPNLLPLIKNPEPFSTYYDRRIECMVKPHAFEQVAVSPVPHEEEPGVPPEASGDGAISQEAFYDVFLAHNSTDKPQVEVIYKELQRRGLKPWLDKKEIPPGRLYSEVIQKAIQSVRAAAIFIGPVGVGRWQALELHALIGKFIEHDVPVIPVLLPGIDEIPDSLLFLRELNWVSFQNHVEEDQPMHDLLWGITGQRPNAPMA